LDFLERSFPRQRFFGIETESESETEFSDAVTQTESATEPNPLTLKLQPYRLTETLFLKHCLSYKLQQVSVVWSQDRKPGRNQFTLVGERVGLSGINTSRSENGRS
jgi:hypothetical protein